MTRQSRPPAFLLTRPAEQSARFADALRLRFGAAVEIVESPLIAPKFLCPDLPQVAVRTLIFSSETGVAGYCRLADHPCLANARTAWCVGDRTADAATQAGLVAHSVDADVEALFATILKVRAPEPLLHIRGRHSAGNLVERLNLAGVETFQAIVYEQLAQPLTPAAHMLLQQTAPVILPVFSPRTARIMADALQKTSVNARLLVAAISAAAAAPMTGFASSLTTAGQPNADSMLDAIATLFSADART